MSAGAGIRRVAAALLRRGRRGLRALRHGAQRVRKGARRLRRRSMETARGLALRCRLATRRVVMLHGLRVRVPRGLPLDLLEVLHSGEYEANEISLVAEHLEPGDRVLELGGGLGVLAAFCARRVGSERVLTFEPNPGLRARILDTFRRNGVAPRLESALVAPRAGPAVLHAQGGFWASSIYPDAHSRAIAVPGRAFDTELRDFDPTFVVMDVEGAEHELVAATDWAGVRKLVIELHPLWLGPERTAEVRARLARAGFVCRSERDNVLYLDRAPEFTVLRAGSRPDSPGPS